MNIDILKFYFSKKLISIFLMGILSGIPLYLILSTLFIWLTRESIDISTVGLFALTSIPWSIKFLWSPFLDKYNVFILKNYLGHRKSWLLLIQFFLIPSLLFLGNLDPNNDLLIIAIVALLISFFSASQDIVIDAFRIEILDEKSQGAGVAMTQLGYRFGGIISGAGTLYLKEIMTWFEVFFTLSIFIISVVFLVIFLINTKKSKKIHNHNKSILEPFKEFIFRNSFFRMILILSFIFFFKFGDVVAGVMANPFYVKIGFSNLEIANASKIFGVIMTVLGVFFGGYLVKTRGIINALIYSGILQIISNLLYIVLYKVGSEFNYLLLTIAGENFSGGLGSAAFVAYLSVLCNKKYTGTQYALLSSVMGIARTVLSSPGGFLVEFVGWGYFFLISTFLGIPGLLILFWMKSNFPINMQTKFSS